MYRFLLSARWLGFAVFVLVIAGLSVQLGLWQFGKLDDRKIRNEQIAEYFAAEPVPLDQVAPKGTTVDSEIQWRQVTAVGRYDSEHEITVRFVQRDGVPGVDVITPLRLDDGTALLINRGFLETARTSNRPDSVPAAPTSEVQVTGWLRADNGAGPSATRLVDGQVRAISSRALADELPYPLRSGYLNLQQQSPPQSGLAAEPKPDLGQGPHFFYGLQWWFFALLAVVGYGWFARVERLQRSEAQASETKSA